MTFILVFNIVIWMFLLSDIFCRRRWDINLSSITTHIFRGDLRQYLNVLRVEVGDTIYLKTEKGLPLANRVVNNWKFVEKMQLQEFGKEYPYGNRFVNYTQCFTFKDLTCAEQVLYGEENEIRKS